MTPIEAKIQSILRRSSSQPGTVEKSSDTSARRYLFICGTARSGTTLLAELLGSNERIVMGIERYINLIGIPLDVQGVKLGSKLKMRRIARRILKVKPIHPDLFTAQRFFDYRKTDGVDSIFVRYRQHYEDARKKFDRAIFVGDKIPTLYNQIPNIARRCPGSTFVFCYRNVYEVAASWTVRLNNPDDKLWPQTSDYIAATLTWNDALRYATAAKEAGYDILPCDYDVLADVVKGKPYYFELLAKLGVSVDNADVAAIERQLAKVPDLRERRTDLSPEMQNEIASLVDMDAVQTFSHAFGVEWQGMVSYPS